MKKLIVLAFTLLLTVSFMAQDFHTPAELLSIMEKSALSYEFNELKTPVSAADRYTDLNYNDSYRLYNDEGFSTMGYELSAAGQESMKLAEKAFGVNNMAGAREQYLAVLKTDSTCYKVMTYIGQTYATEGDYKNAIMWYENTIKKNYIDYMSHWFLADIYFELGENDKALNEITIAQILNRNNPRIKTSFDRIYTKKKLKTPGWMFNPQYVLEQKDEKSVTMKLDASWTGYALAKAIWKFEPGYKKSMGVNENEVVSMVEEKEALVTQLVAMDKKDVKKSPEMSAFSDALDKKMVDEYIIYEIFLPQYPVIAYNLPEDLIKDVAKYVIEVRSAK